LVKFARYRSKTCEERFLIQNKKTILHYQRYFDKSFIASVKLANISITLLVWSYKLRLYSFVFIVDLQMYCIISINLEFCPISK